MLGLFWVLKWVDNLGSCLDWETELNPLLDALLREGVIPETYS